MTDDAGLDRHQTRAAGEQTVRLHAGDPAAAEGRALPTSEDALSRQPTKLDPRAPMRPPGTPEVAKPTGKARADRGHVAARRRKSGAITASTPLRKRGQTVHRIAVRWPTGRAP